MDDAEQRQREREQAHVTAVGERMLAAMGVAFSQAMLPPGRVVEVTLRHEEGCALAARTGSCDCRPHVTFGQLGGLDPEDN